MAKYDDLYADATAGQSVFAAKAALDPLREPPAIYAREAQERALANLLGGVTDGYLPSTIAVYGPPGTGKTATARRVCREFAERHPALAAEYMNLKECRTQFSVANEILVELTGDHLPAYHGLDGVFDAIWDALTEYPAWPVLILDEIDHIKHDANFAPSDFFYRLLRGEGRQSRGLNLCVVVISNELIDTDLRLDSRVRSALSGETIFFPPYTAADLATILTPRLDRAFAAGALPDDVVEFGLEQAAARWGDARKALTLFRRAGETANDRTLDAVTKDCITVNLDTTDRDSVVEKITGLPENHVVVLTALVARRTGRGEIIHPVTINEIYNLLNHPDRPDRVQLGRRRIRELIDDLELLGLVDSWVEAQGNNGRRKHITPAVQPDWIVDAQAQLAVDNTPDDEEITE